jgi:sodium transport system ATP-binding protein
MIVVRELTKIFQDKKRGRVLGADGVSFETRGGEVFGLLGPNGAGKTTTLRMLATILQPTGGTAEIAGHDIVRDPRGVRASIGFLSGDMGLYARLTPREVLTTFGRLSGWNGKQLADRVTELLARFGADQFADSRIDGLSTGMRQRVAIARALVHDPPVLILDEPTGGLDVPTAHAVEQFVQEAKRGGKCILLSTHVMEEAEYLCDRIGVIDRGQIQALGTMEELRARTGRQRLREVFLALLGLEKKEAAACN